MHISSLTALPSIQYSSSENSESLELLVWLVAIMGLTDEILLIVADQTLLYFYLFKSPFIG